MFRFPSAASWLIVLVTVVACDGRQMPSTPTTPSSPTQPPSSSLVADDAALFRLVTQTDPFGSYTVFPSVDAVTTGTLIGSDAHRPMIRVSLSATARGVLQNGRLPDGARFPDGSVVFKEILEGSGSPVSVYAIMYKAATDARAGSGWLWAELGPTGNVVYSINNRGAACTSCHLLEQGPWNDLVRTFERQR